MGPPQAYELRIRKQKLEKGKEKNPIHAAHEWSTQDRPGAPSAGHSPPVISKECEKSLFVRLWMPVSGEMRRIRGHRADSEDGGNIPDRLRLTSNKNLSILYRNCGRRPVLAARYGGLGGSA